MKYNSAFFDQAISNKEYDDDFEYDEDEVLTRHHQKPGGTVKTKKQQKNNKWN